MSKNSLAVLREAGSRDRAGQAGQPGGQEGKDPEGDGRDRRWRKEGHGRY